MPRLVGQTVQFTREQLQWLLAQARRRGMSLSRIVREAVDRAMKRAGKSK
jgi:uncharacterized protein YgbK (DUF1537 family)